MWGLMSTERRRERLVEAALNVEGRKSTGAGAVRTMSACGQGKDSAAGASSSAPSKAAARPWLRGIKSRTGSSHGAEGNIANHSIHWSQNRV